MKPIKIMIIALASATASLNASASDTFANLFTSGSFSYASIILNHSNGNSPVVKVNTSRKSATSASVSVTQGSKSFYCFVYKRDNSDLFEKINDIANNHANYSSYVIQRNGSTCTYAMTYSQAPI